MKEEEIIHVTGSGAAIMERKTAGVGKSKKKERLTKGPAEYFKRKGERRAYKYREKKKGGKEKREYLTIVGSMKGRRKDETNRFLPEKVSTETEGGGERITATKGRARKDGFIKGPTGEKGSCEKKRAKADNCQSGPV